MKHGNLCLEQKEKKIITIKWIFIRNLNEYGQVVSNKSRLGCKGYAQVEGVGFEETFFM